MTSLVKSTTDLSIGVQILTTIVGIWGLFIHVDPTHQILQKILRIETFVQIVELFFYVFFIRSSMLTNMAAVRYFDWFITTPTMLITSAIYYKYEELLYKSDNNSEKLTISNFINTNANILTVIIVLNALMLIFGYAGERGVLTKTSSTIGGFGFFAVAFYILYDRFAKYSPVGNNLFFVMFLIWNTYGIAYLFTPAWKNITFNGLDILAKNFFGIYLFYKITMKSKRYSKS